MILLATLRSLPRERTPVSHLLNYRVLAAARARDARGSSVPRSATENTAPALRKNSSAACRAATGDRPCIWLHAVSVGEVNLLARCWPNSIAAGPMSSASSRRRPITGSRAGEARNTRRAPSSTAPLDFTWAVRCCHASHSPRRARAGGTGAVAEPDLRAAKPHGVEVAIVNGRLSDEELPRLPQNRLACATAFCRAIDLIAAQNEEYAERFLQLAARRRCDVTGSLKFDGADTDRNNPPTRELAELAGIAAERHRLPRRQHAGTRRTAGHRLSRGSSRASTTATDPRPARTQIASTPSPSCSTAAACRGSAAAA